MNSLKINGAEIINKALKIDDTLLISDLHFGYETSLNKQGLMIPPFQFDKIIDVMEDIQRKANARNIILNGDIKHNFGTIDKQEWKEVLGFIDYLSDSFIDIRVIKGNHDNFTQYILNKRDLSLEDYVIIDNYYITHGHKIPEEIPESINTIIIGHEHPCIGIRNGERVEKFKSYLKGTWNDYDLIVMPSFTPVSQGSDILHEKTISPFIKKLEEFEVYAIDEDIIYPFGLIKDLLSIDMEL
ncbi:metallophosphoesterase [Methanosphaera sp.]